jgi:hypothetical protein
VGNKRGRYGVTRKLTLLVSLPLGVVTWTLPEVGTMVVISET